MKSVIIQINEKGSFAVSEHRAELNELFKEFASSEVEIVIRKTDYFTTLLEESIALQKKHKEASESFSWTNEDFTTLRCKMSACYFNLMDEYNIAKVNEKEATMNKELCYERKQAEYIDTYSPAQSKTKAKSTDEYKQVYEKYLQAYKIRSLFDLHVKALDNTMNAISGAQKHGISHLKF